MSTLAELKGSLTKRIHTMELLQAKMTSPVQYHYQETEIKAIDNLISDLIELATRHGSNIEATEIADFRDTLNNIEDKTFVHTLLRDMKATQPLSHKTIETDPNKAATWFLQYKGTL